MEENDLGTKYWPGWGGGWKENMLEVWAGADCWYVGLIRSKDENVRTLQPKRYKKLNMINDYLVYNMEKKKKAWDAHHCKKWRSTAKQTASIRCAK